MKNRIIGFAKKIIISIFNVLMPRSTAVNILTGPIRGSRWFYFSGVPAYFFGTFERKKIEEYFIPEIKKAKNFYDIGANVGYYTLVAAKYMSSDSKIFSFEPSKRNLSSLEKHIKENHVRRVNIIPLAVSNNNRPVLLKEAPENGMDNIISKNGDYEVAACTLDEYCESCPKPDVIKMDVEGAEMLVFEGAQKIIANYHPIIFLSTHSLELENSCFNFLKQFGYSIIKIEENEYLAKI